MNVDIIFGPPGTGKTHRLLSEVDAEIESGTDPSRIAFVSHTKRAVGEAVSRVAGKSGMRADDLQWFRTIHSMAYSLGDTRRSDVMGEEDYKAIAKVCGGVKFSFQYGDDDAAYFEVGASGDAMLSAYSWMRSRNGTVEDVLKCGRWNVDRRSFLRFVRTIEAYKRDTKMIDFSDMLDRPVRPASIDVGVIDEAQDLTDLQWRASWKMMRGARRWIIAGDDDQAIHEWAGARSDVMGKLPGNRTVLDQSFRVPKKVHKFAATISSRISRRVPKTWRPRSEEGVVRECANIEQIDPVGGSWFILVRNRFMLPKMARWLEGLGRTYVMDGKSVIEKDSIQAVLIYERLRKGVVVSRRDAELLKRFFPRMEVPTDDEVEDVSWSDLKFPFTGQPTWLEICGRYLILPDRDDLLVRRMRAKGESFTSQPKITLSTIHGVKGSEADHVLLCPDVSSSTANGFRDRPDQEHRIWYVAATRARESLTILTSTRREFYQFT